MKKYIIDTNALISLLSCWPDPIPDFGDAVIASIGKITRRSAIVTFDQKFTNNLKSLGLNVWDS